MIVKRSQIWRSRRNRKWSRLKPKQLDRDSIEFIFFKQDLQIKYIKKTKLNLKYKLYWNWNLQILKLPRTLNLKRASLSWLQGFGYNREDLLFFLRFSLLWLLPYNERMIFFYKIMRVDLKRLKVYRFEELWNPSKVDFSFYLRCPCELSKVF